MIELHSWSNFLDLLLGLYRHNVCRQQAEDSNEAVSFVVEMLMEQQYSMKNVLIDCAIDIPLDLLKYDV